MTPETPSRKSTLASRLWIELAFFVVVFIAVEALAVTVSHQVTLAERLVFWSVYVAFRIAVKSRARRSDASH